jgi:hypothetical protein
MKRLLLCLILTGLCLAAVPAMATAPIGGEGWLTISCEEDGASVYLDDTYKGTISGGSLDIANGVAASTYTVKKAGFYDASGDINYVPGGSANLEITVSLTPKPTGSGNGWITVYCNVDGASVALNGVTKGTISGGAFTQEVSTTGTPYTTYKVSRSGYVTYSGTIDAMPADGETISLYATLNPVPTTTQPTTASTLIGGDAGWYTVSCNVNGASVSFDSTYKGVITNGVLTVPVYSTGTPYSIYRVEKSGYVTASGTLPSAPAKGQTVSVPVLLSPAATQIITPLPATTASPAGSGTGYIAVHANVDGATVTIASYPAGVIRNGVLKIPVSTTGTPFSEFTVAKAGYVTTTGTVPRQPAAGETVDIYVTLNPEQTTPVPTTQSPLSLPIVIAGIIGAILVMGARRA